MSRDEAVPLGWRGRLRLAMLRVTRDPILSSRVERLELRLDQVERALDDVRSADAPVAGEIVAPPVQVGGAGRMQLLEQRVESLQARFDVLSLTLGEYRAELAEIRRMGL